MAYVGNSRHQSRLAREMARDLGRNDHSIASSTGSHHGSVSSDDSWDPENEAECSTGRKFPELRDTAKKYGKWNAPASDKDNNTDNYYLDTSAIGRAFPDFTQGIDSDLSSALSVEDGRGAKAGARQRVPSSRVVRQEYSDNVDAVLNVSNYRVMGTPPLVDIKAGAQSSKQASRQQALRAEGRTSARSTPQKENVAPTAPPSSGRRQKNYISGATRTASGEQRRTVAELQAGVADDSDGSFISDERPATVTLTKSSRFAQPRASPLAKIQNVAKPTLASTLAAKRPLNRDTPKKAPQPTSPSPATRYGSVRKAPGSNNQTTEQSFLIPNADAFSVIGAGSPAPNRSVLGSSRFGGGSGRPSGTGHNKIDSVPVPTDEKAIFLSLQLLQDKVSSMESDRANDARHIKKLEEDNYKLEVKNEELERRRRSDSALGDSGSEAEKLAHNKLQRLLESQKKDLEAQVAEQNKIISTLERSLQEKEAEMSQLVEQCNNATSQLEEAYDQLDHFEQENQNLQKENSNLQKENAQLKGEKIDLIQENSQMKAQLARLGKETEENTRHWNNKEEDFRNQLKNIVAVPDVQLRQENADLKTHLSKINSDFANVQKQLEQLNKALSKETARAENLENATRQFNMKEAELREKLANETNRRTELENATRMMDNKTVEFMSKKESDLRAKLDEEIKRRSELEATTRQALIKENELRDRLDSEINRRANTIPGQNKTEQMIREEVTREFMLKERDFTQKVERREKAINKVRGLMDEITAQNLPPTKVSRRQRSASQPQSIEREATRTLQKDGFNVDFEDFSIPPMNKTIQTTEDGEVSDDGSFAMDTTQTIHKDINVTANSQRDKQDTQSTNFSDICGPGVMQAMRDGAAYARFRKAEIDAGRPDPEEFIHNMTMNGQNDTMASVRSARSARSNKSAKQPVGILKRGEGDDTMRSMMSQKSVRHDDTMRSMASQRSQRRHSVPEVVRQKADKGKANATIDLTSAYLVQDITFAHQASTSARAEPLSESAKEVLNRLCHHDSGNCTMCTRIATYDSAGKMVKQTVTIKRPIAISTLERAPDATIRPSMAPGKALAKVLKGLEDELAHLNMGHAGLQRAYFALDAKQSGKQGKVLEDKLVMSLKGIQRKRKQIYELGDVVEGLKETGLEMTQSEIEVTLVGLGLDAKVVAGVKEDTVTGKYFEEHDASWAGIEESTQ